jgi:UDP-N-acetylglucosamine--N-acetylmuramyl-(pentapeptide) pyrophosphoryl-undecaprenol N-acetylglucosamine transferase
VQEKQADLHAVYGFSREKPLLFFVMGSLGSSTVSAVLDEACGRLLPRAQILIAAGRSNDYTFRSQGEGLRIEEYVNGKAALKQADLCVSRAGATTLAEITALGAASILVPSPYVPNNHQYYNARRLADEQAAVLIEEKDLSAERLTETIETLLDHPEDLKRMRLNAAALGKPDAAYQMIDWMEELADARNAG